MTDAADIDDHAWGEALRRRQIERLAELAEISLEMLRILKAAAIEPGADVRAISNALAKTGRCLRYTGDAQSRLLKDLDQAKARALYLSKREEPAFDETPLDRHIGRVTRIVGRIASREHRGDEDEIERLAAECSERLEDEDVYGDISGRSVPDLVRLICKDLALDPTPFLHEAWAVEELDQEDARPPPQAGEVAQRAGGGMPMPRWFEACAPPSPT